jgi:hypothetical protein
VYHRSRGSLDDAAARYRDCQPRDRRFLGLCTKEVVYDRLCLICVKAFSFRLGNPRQRHWYFTTQSNHAAVNLMSLR